MKILAIDYGDSHTGLAACDKTETIASPIGVIHDKNFDSVLEKTAAAVVEYEIGEVVVGNPINMNGSLGPRSQLCQSFAEKLRLIVDVPVHMWDERSTTVTANQIMNETNKRGKKRRESVDAIAAAVILESYLAYRANHKEK